MKAAGQCSSGISPLSVIPALSDARESMNGNKTRMGHPKPFGKPAQAQSNGFSQWSRRILLKLLHFLGTDASPPSHSMTPYVNSDIDPDSCPLMLLDAWV
jgi:hypothetical protein